MWPKGHMDMSIMDWNWYVTCTFISLRRIDIKFCEDEMCTCKWIVLCCVVYAHIKMNARWIREVNKLVPPKNIYGLRDEMALNDAACIYVYWKTHTHSHTIALLLLLIRCYCATGCCCYSSRNKTTRYALSMFVYFIIDTWFTEDQPSRFEWIILPQKIYTTHVICDYFPVRYKQKSFDM